MPIDITRNIDRFESEDLRQFSYVNTANVPSTVSLILYNTDGATLAPVAVQSGLTVTVSGASNVGLFYVFRQLPASVGIYTYEWRAYGSGTAQQSLTVIERGEFEVIRTEPHSFFTYGDRVEVMRRARQLVGRADITQRDVRPYMEAADGWIDSKLGKIMSVPLSPTPLSLREMSNRMAIYFLYNSQYGGQRSEEPPGVVRQFDKDDKFLDGIVEGKYALAGSGVSFVSEQPISAITGGIEGGTPTFGRSDWVDQAVDEDITDAEDDARD